MTIFVRLSAELCVWRVRACCFLWFRI